MNGKQPQDLRERTTGFALRVIRFYMKLPKTTEAQISGKQVLRSGTSVGAHYRESSRARSRAEFISKLEGGLQELDETIYWLELLQRSGIGDSPELQSVREEANALTSIFVTSIKTAKENRDKENRTKAAPKNTSAF
jgi:four helix bundle protein